MYQKHHTRGIVVSVRRAENDSRRVEIFTEKFGVLSAHVQGARKLKSRLRAGVQYLSCGEFSLVRGKSGWKVVSARPEKNFFESLKGRPALRSAGQVLNLIKKLVSEEESGGSLFAIVTNFLDFLAESKESDSSLAECLTLLRILHSLGYMRHDPELSVPLTSSEIGAQELALIAPKRARIVGLINESLKTL